MFQKLAHEPRLPMHAGYKYLIQYYNRIVQENILCTENQRKNSRGHMLHEGNNSLLVYQKLVENYV
jgi:hypothetical protein